MPPPLSVLYLDLFVINMKLDAKALRYMSSEDFRVLTAVSSTMIQKMKTKQHYDLAFFLTQFLNQYIG